MDIDIIYNEDCLVGMERIPDRSIDMVLCDLPYGTTACKWDVVIPFNKLWEKYKRIVKDNGAILLFGTEPFSTIMRNSNLNMYRYDWIWNKQRGANFTQANIQPMKSHEIISVFYFKRPTYNPQYWYSKPYTTGGGRRRNPIQMLGVRKIETAREIRAETNHQDGRRYPLSILNFTKEFGLHPTQKPVPLLEYLIKTYTNKNDVVLDNCIGSGSTAIACINTDRHYIGFEKNESYYKSALDRISQNPT